MFTYILIGLLCYSLGLTLFLVGWHRWQVRMARMTAACHAHKE